MTLEEMDADPRNTITKPLAPVCDPCSINPMSEKDEYYYLGSGMRIEVDEVTQLARYMVLTEDGRWVPVEEWYG